MIVTRFAPSPTGYLHLGHAYSALFAYEAAQKAGGKFLLRIEDIDPVRCRPEFTDAIVEDLGWLGLKWGQPVRRQSEHLNDYAAALSKLREKGVLYPCFCTRKEIAEESAAAGHAPHLPASVPDGPVYPGTCRNLSLQEQEDRFSKIGGVPLPSLREGLGAGQDVEADPSPAKTKDLPKCGKSKFSLPLPQGERSDNVNWRLDVAKALEITGPLTWCDEARGEQQAKPQDFGDVVLARKDVPTSYHLSVTADDHLQGITLVTRGEDLFRATDIHRLLQALLGYEVPRYHHHKLLTDAEGKRFAKRDKAVTLRALRAEAKSPEEIKAMLLKF